MIEPVGPKAQLPQNPNPPSVESPHQSVQDKIDQSIPKLSKSESKIEPPKLTSPIVKQPTVPVVELPSKPIPVVVSTAVQKLVISKTDGVSLINGPGPKFREVGRLNKGDSLPLIRNTTVEFNGEPWLMVDADGR